MDLRIPLTDVAWQHGQLRSELAAAVDRLLDDPVCDGSVPLKRFEENIARWLGVPHAAGVQSGTAGLFLALRALGIGPGDDVITVPNSDLPTTAAIGHAGARFVLVDVEPDSFNLDPALIEAHITPRTRAIMPVHLYGHPADMDPIIEVARRHGLAVVEDATLALGATYHGRPCGTIGDLGVFSFSPRKILGCLGNGGLVVARDPELDRRVRALRGYGLDPARQDLPIAERLRQPGLAHVVEGYNLKLDGLQAAVLDVKLPYLRDWLGHRHAVAARYTARFAGTRVTPPGVRAGCKHAWRNYVVQLDGRDASRARLHAAGIAAATLYAPPVYRQPVYRHLGIDPAEFPVAEAQAARLLALPIYPGMPLEWADEVAELVLLD